MIDLAPSFERFVHMLSAGERHLARGDAEAAAGLAQLAAGYAFPANAGVFASPRLEQLLIKLGAGLDVTDHGPTIRKGTRKRIVVHILSYAKPIGGDSRYVLRWVKEDDQSCHVVVVTSQAEVAGRFEVPDEFVQAAKASGGFVHCLRALRSRPLQAAMEVRALCRQADVVALHVYPYDVIPVIALAAGCDHAKTVYVHHSDHTFWVGASVAHRVAHLRSQPEDFLTHQRHLDPAKFSQLPIPIETPLHTMPRDAARAALGHGADEVVLLTIASPFKYSAPNETNFLELVLPVLDRHPHVRLVAIGPSSSGAWAQAASATGGRVSALGRRWGNEAFCAAADVYLDSVPFSSITSLLEAGINGVPLLGLGPRNAEVGLLGAGAPGLDGVMLVADDAAQYRAHLERLICNAEMRSTLGACTRNHIMKEHTGRNWLGHLERLYAELSVTEHRGCLTPGPERLNTGALSQTLMRLFQEAQPGLRTRQLIGEHIGALAYASRLPISLQLHREGLELCYLNLLPPPLNTWMRHLGRRAKAFVAA